MQGKDRRQHRPQGVVALLSTLHLTFLSLHPSQALVTRLRFCATGRLVIAQTSSPC